MISVQKNLLITHVSVENDKILRKLANYYCDGLFTGTVLRWSLENHKKYYKQNAYFDGVGVYLTWIRSKTDNTLISSLSDDLWFEICSHICPPVVCEDMSYKCRKCNGKTVLCGLDKQGYKHWWKCQNTQCNQYIRGYASCIVIA